MVQFFAYNWNIRFQFAENSDCWVYIIKKHSKEFILKYWYNT